MSIEANKAIVRRLFEEALNTGDFTLADAAFVEHGGAADLLSPLLRIGAVRVVG